MLLALVASHDTVPLDQLAALELDRTALSRALTQRNLDHPQHPLDGWVLLSTCNRIELYLDTALFHDGIDLAVAAIADVSGLPTETVERIFVPSNGTDAATHLFSVASGLRSMVIGEAEITGQVRGAFHDALHDERTTAMLNDLFQQGLRTAKRVASTTSIGAAGRSSVAVALDRAVELLGPLAGRSVLVIGTGAYARVALAELAGRGVQDTAVFSPSGRAVDFAATRSAHPVGAGELADGVTAADLVIACSGQSGVVLTADMIPGDGRERVVLDLALVSDVDPAVASRPGVTVVNLTSVASSLTDADHPAVGLAEQTVRGGVCAYESRQRIRRLDPAIAAIRGVVRDAVEDELASLRGRVDPDTAEEIERSLRRVYRKMLHDPTVRARRLAEEGDAERYIDALNTVFGLDLAADPH